LPSLVVGKCSPNLHTLLTITLQVVRRLTLIAALLLTGAVACGTQATQGEKKQPKGTGVVATTASRGCAYGSFRRLGSSRVAYVAVVRSRAAVARRPGGPLLARFGKLNVNGAPTVFSIRGAALGTNCRPSSYLVQIPTRPNGVTGWVPADQVTVARVSTRIVVDLSQKRVSLYRDGRKLLSTPAAIGAPATPTPTGSFYVNQRLIPVDRSGPFGPGAVGISAFSDVLTGWTQGGPIAIHGTNAPWSIGKAVSNGCIRIPNPMLKRVFAQALNGTPVLIRR
jgi:lipoprotein-anchoring transpeptidase ErfK/SrfK